jgi:multidrug efflux pump subunit AcrA (membrane-fusion protein)
MSRRIGWTYLILVLLLPTVLTGCGKRATGDNPGKKDPTAAGGNGSGEGDAASARHEYAVPVAIRSLTRVSMNEYISTVGSVAPARSVAVKAEESGRIHFVKPWREGESVKEGQLLARLDEAETSRDIEIARADLEAARSELDLAVARVERSVADLARAEQMYKFGQIAPKVYEERKFTADSAKISHEQAVIRVQRAQKQLERLQLQMDRKIVRAPMSGYLVANDTLQNRDKPSAADSSDSITDLEGRLVGVGTAICGIMDVANVMIRCDVTSKDIGRIRKGQRAEAHVYSEQEIAVEGSVSDVSPIMDLNTRAFEVDVAVANSDGQLRPGMYGRVNIITRTHRDALVVDRKVLQRRNNEDIVFLVNEQERAEKRVVKLGLENPDQVEVVEGLRAGERLVVLGFETLQDKVKVKIVESEPTVAAKDQPTSRGATATQPNGRA